MENFWGVILKPEKRYEQVVAKPFHITKACIEPSTASQVTSVYMESENDEFIICNLGGNILNENLNLDFYPGDKICIRTSGGTGVVHLTGSIMQEMPDFADDEETDESLDEEAEEEVEEEEEISKSKVLKRKIDDSLSNLNKKQKKADVDKTLKMKNKLQKQEVKKINNETDDDDDSSEDMDYTSEIAQEVPSDDEEEDSDDEDDEIKSPPPSLSKGKKTQKVLNGKKPEEKKTPSKEMGKTPPSKASNGSSASPNTPNKRNIKGILVEDVKVGGGPEAKSGKMIGMYYEGRSKAGKRFDATLTGKPFKFRLGAGEVIKGWDLGLAGIKVGGKRRLTIPPNMAYGSKGAPPDIPPNATLVFDVECKYVQ